MLSSHGAPQYLERALSSRQEAVQGRARSSNVSRSSRSSRSARSMASSASNVFICCLVENKAREIGLVYDLNHVLH